MNRYFLGSHMAVANIVRDGINPSASRFFDDGTLAAETRREYTVADKLAVVELLNQRDAGAGCPKGWEEAAWARPVPTIEEIQEESAPYELTEREIYSRGLAGVAP
jgi:hypothetical protein